MLSVPNGCRLRSYHPLFKVKEVQKSTDSGEVQREGGENGFVDF